MPRRVAAPPILLLPLLLSGGILAATLSAHAQVTTSQQALDALGSNHRAVSHPAAKARPAHRRPVGPPPARGGKPLRAASAHPPAATIPPGPPPAPVFRAPAINVPLHPPPPPPPVPVVQTAVGAVTPINGGTRISFGPGSADLNPATMEALHGVSGQLKNSPVLRVDLDAYGSVTEDDPSTPRRLAFERGIAARAVLINDGIASTRIYLRVIGAAPAPASPGGGGVTPDRVDLVLSPALPAASPAGTPAATAPAGQPAP